MGRFEFGHLTFSESRSYSPFVLEKDGVVGWWGPAPVRRETPDRVTTDGQFALPGYRRGRLVELRGHVLARSRLELHALADSFGSLSLGRQRLTEVREAGSRWAWGSLMDSDFMHLFDAQTGHFELQIFCDEPWRYGEERIFETTTGKAVEVHHRGNADAWPIIRIDGPVSGGWQVGVGWNRRVTYRDPIPASDSLTLDTYTGIATHSRYGVVNTVITGATDPVPPGVNQFVHFWGSGGGKATVRLFDTYS